MQSDKQTDWLWCSSQSCCSKWIKPLLDKHNAHYFHLLTYPSAWVFRHTQVHAHRLALSDINREYMALKKGCDSCLVSLLINVKETIKLARNCVFIMLKIPNKCWIKNCYLCGFEKRKLQEDWGCCHDRFKIKARRFSLNFQTEWFYWNMCVCMCTYYMAVWLY